MVEKRQRSIFRIARCTSTDLHIWNRRVEQRLFFKGTMMIYRKSVVLPLYIVLANLTVCRAGHDDDPQGPNNPSPPVKGEPSSPPTFYPVVAPSIVTLSPIAAPALVPTVDGVARYDVPIEQFSLLLGPLERMFSSAELGLIEQVTESHLKKLWDERMGNDSSIISLNVVKEDRKLLRRLQTATSAQVLLEGTSILFSDSENEVEPAVVNQFIVLQAFEGENGDDFLVSTNEVLSEFELSYVSASEVELSSITSSTSDNDSSFWDDYGLYIIIAGCALITIFALFGYFSYTRRRQGNNVMNTSKVRESETTSQNLSYSRKRFFEKATNDLNNELNTSPDELIEFEHNLHEIQDPSSFKFSDEPVEDKLGHYYAVKDKFNANFTDEEMKKATEKGQVLASRAFGDNQTPQQKLQPVHESSNQTPYSHDTVSPLGSGSAHGKYYRNAPKIKLQPSDEESVEVSPPTTPKLPAPKVAAPNVLSEREVSPLPSHKIIEQPSTPASVSKDACLGDIFSNYLCGVKKTEVSSPPRKSLKEITIDAPAGKLGVYLDGSNVERGEPCVVHNLKPNSVLKGKLLAGDMLIEINNKDVRKMEAIEVSKMLSRTNKQKRKIVVLRYMSNDSDAKTSTNDDRNDKKFNSIVSNAQKSLQKQRSFSGVSAQSSRKEFQRIRSGKIVTMTADYDSDDSEEIVVDIVD